MLELSAFGVSILSAMRPVRLPNAKLSILAITRLRPDQRSNCHWRSAWHWLPAEEYPEITVWFFKRAFKNAVEWSPLKLEGARIMQKASAKLRSASCSRRRRVWLPGPGKLINTAELENKTPKFANLETKSGKYSSSKLSARS